MNLSRTFILRPVATSLLMAAILLAGAVAYRQLPVSALPQVDYPTIQVADLLPGRKSGRDGFLGHGSVGAAIWTGAWSEPDDLHQLLWKFGHHAAVCPRFKH